MSPLLTTLPILDFFMTYSSLPLPESRPALSLRALCSIAGTLVFLLSRPGRVMVECYSELLSVAGRGSSSIFLSFCKTMLTVGFRLILYAEEMNYNKFKNKVVRSCRASSSITS